ncbi:MAG: transketolase [Cyclobacteriaceae bacterium]
MSKNIHQLASDNMKVLSIAMVEKANSGHPGGPMGGTDFMHILYTEFLNFDPEDPKWPFRDRFFMDAGHLSALLYSQLHLFGFYSKDDIMNFRQWGSCTPGHPEVDVAKGIENTSGPLGQGHAMGVGAAVAERFLTTRFGDWMAHNIYAYISDGGVQEEISQGVGRIAGFLGLSNLIMFFDSNDVQLSTRTEDVTIEDTAKKYEAWGWKVLTIDGHDHDEIRKALKQANEENEKPFLIIGRTVMGKGAVDEAGNPSEGAVNMHGQPISKTAASYEKTVEHLGGSVDDPFLVYPEVEAHYSEVVKNKKEQITKRREEEKSWRASNPELSAKLDLFLSGKIPDIDFSKVEHKPNGATREASSAVLGYLAGKVENLIVSSADLANSDKTDGFLKKTTALKKGDFSGNFLHSGVSEFSMAAMANGMALHGGVIPVVGTFFIFSDYQKPAFRLSALMELPVKYLWTHDAFRVGEDGPTHQPIEQEAQLRLMEKVQNHSHKRSLTALRPADGDETKVAWKMALENTEGPTGLIFSRQGVKDVAPISSSRYEEALQAEKGAYIVRDDNGFDVTLIANGSEVSTLVGAADILAEKGIKSRIVSVISEGIFREQSDDYQQDVLPNDKSSFGLTAGLPINLEGLVGPKGKVFGLSHFGYSAPAGTLDDKFGFTPEKVAGEVMAYLEK